MKEAVLKWKGCGINDNIKDVCDLAGYKHDFYATNGFDVEGVDYTADVPRMDQI